MIELCATHFAAQNPKITIANRTLERGEKLGQSLSGRAIRLADVPNCLHEFDIVVSCSFNAANLGFSLVERAIKARRHRPMFMVDLAVPRDIENEVAKLDDVFLYTVDDLASVVQSGLENRHAAVKQAEAIIRNTRAIFFMHWIDGRHVVPLIKICTKAAKLCVNMSSNALAKCWHAVKTSNKSSNLVKGITAKLPLYRNNKHCIKAQGERSCTNWYAYQCSYSALSVSYATLRPSRLHLVLVCR